MFSFLPVIHFSDSYSYVFYEYSSEYGFQDITKSFPVLLLSSGEDPFLSRLMTYTRFCFLGLRKFQLIQAAYSIVIWPVFMIFLFSCYSFLFFSDITSLSVLLSRHTTDLWFTRLKTEIINLCSPFAFLIFWKKSDT
jgi:hypothetical protein